MYHTTGFSKDEITELCTLVHATGMSSGGDGPDSSGLVQIRCGHVDLSAEKSRAAGTGEYYEVSQSTISRAITAITPALARMMRPFTPTAEELPSDEQLIVDGTLVSCWSWDNHPELHSGKHHTTGLNLQVVCDLVGRLRWISDPVEGCRHDSAALRGSGVLDGVDTGDWIGDKDVDAPRGWMRVGATPVTPATSASLAPIHVSGYIGLAMITPIRKPPHRELLDWEKEFNTAINKIRWRIEQTIANLKTWRILHTDYRRPLATFADTISAVIGLQFYRTA